MYNSTCKYMGLYQSCVECTIHLRTQPSRAHVSGSFCMYLCMCTQLSLSLALSLSFSLYLALRTRLNLSVSEIVAGRRS
jgi:hypothetical protein